MNRPFAHLCRLAGALATLAAALLATATAAPAAFALPIPPPGRGDPAAPSTVRVVTGGMPGWHIALIAIGAALLAATVAVFLDRAWADHRDQAHDPGPASNARPRSHSAARADNVSRYRP